MKAAASRVSTAVTATATNTHTDAWMIVPGSSGPTPCAITALEIAPNTATPTALPAERANAFIPVTAPRSPQPTEACAAISVGAALHPSPKPKRNAMPAITNGFGHEATEARAMAATVVMLMPINVVRRKPMRRYRRPAFAAASGQPRVRAATARPESNGAMPVDPSR